MTRTKVSSEENPESSFIIICVFSAVLFVLIFWQIVQSPFIQIVKSILGGLFLVYYSWELTYFDSLVPGVQPASPLSPSAIKSVSGHNFHMNHALALVNGAFFALFINWWA